MNSPDLQSELVRAALRGDVLDVILGILLSGAGVLALALFGNRSRRKDTALLWFGVFAGLCGIRLLAKASVVHFIMDPVPREFWPYLIAVITYVIPLPGMLFFRHEFPIWRPMLRWFLIAQGAFALAGISTDLIRRVPESFHTANNILVLFTWCVFGTAIFKMRHSEAADGGVRKGVAIFGLTVLLNNLSGLGAFRLPFDPEPVGFTIFLITLGRLVASRTIAKEERLISLDKELEIARKIQATILPRESPRTSRLRVASRYLPMTAVAGDFYDFLTLDENRIGFLIADVSGHGVPAALIASMVKIAIAGQLPHADDPSRVLGGINEMLSGKLKGQFVTASYLFLDLEKSVMRYSGAGHPPLLRRHEPTGKVEKVVQNGLVLGARAKSAYATLERPIASADRFLMYTDGLLEARNNGGEQFEDGRLGELLESTSGTDAEGAATAIVEGLAIWTGRKPQDDDLTLIVVDVL